MRTLITNAPQAEQPFDLLRIDGRSCKLFRNTEQRTAVEAMEGFLPWNGKEDNLIDRFDGRALLDFYRQAVIVAALAQQHHAVCTVYCHSRLKLITVLQSMECQGAGWTAQATQDGRRARTGRGPV